MKLDKIDRRILQILQSNGRITNKDLASQLNLSAPPTLERVKKLESNGFIESYAAMVNAKKVGLTTIMMVSVTLHQHSQESIQEFRRAIETFDEIMECYHVTGDDDYMLKVMCQDIAEYETFMVEKLSRINSLGKIKSAVVLSTIKNQQVLPIAD